jgi:hypothetical protein
MAHNHDDDDDRPRKRSSRDDEDDVDDDRPRKRSAPDRDEVQSSSKKAGPMPTRLVGAIIASMAWGILILHGSCMQSGNALFSVVETHRLQQQQEKMREDLRKAGFNQLDPTNMRFDGSMAYASLGANVFSFLAAALLLAGGIALLMRKAFGKYLAMGAPVLMVLVDLIAFVIFLVLTKGAFLAPHNIGIIINFLFGLVVGGIIIFLLLNKDVSKALK